MFAVAYPTKILFWKRITAYCCTCSKVQRLLLILQRYYFESESQRNFRIVVGGRCCCLSYKDTILKANHSRSTSNNIHIGAVAYPTKILFWKRITAPIERGKGSGKLLLILQRYYFESESQRTPIHTLSRVGCCLSYKDTILKANHSNAALLTVNVIAVAYPTKILFWKRITAPLSIASSVKALLLILQRYYFESESQLVYWIGFREDGCCLSYKDTILKANHSVRNCVLTDVDAVAYPTKILFWKRITAASGTGA